MTNQVFEKMLDVTSWALGDPIFELNAWITSIPKLTIISYNVASTLVIQISNVVCLLL